MADADHKNGGICPACDRFIGPLDTCPYCDAPARKSFSIRALRYASLVLALAGMALLYLVARHSDVPAVEIGAVRSTMNSAMVRVTGTVMAAPATNRASGRYVSFPLSDGSGRLTVAAYEPCAGLLLERDLLPRRGDTVEVSGTVSIRSPGARRIIVELPEQLKVLRKAVDKVQLGAQSGAEGSGFR